MHLLMAFAVGIVAVSGCGEGDLPQPSDPQRDDHAPRYAEAVDLGIVVDGRRILWANMNVGAEDSEEYGAYVAWGDTVGYVADSDHYFNWSTYLLSDHGTWGHYRLTRYCQVPTLGADGFTDRLTRLEPDDDVARRCWGGRWRMPTAAEMEALIAQCEWTWVRTKTGCGYLITGGGNSIYMPAAGYRTDNELRYVHSTCSYWTSTIYRDSESAYALYYDYEDREVSDNYRSYGRSVRPVIEAE